MHGFGKKKQKKNKNLKNRTKQKHRNTLKKKQNVYIFIGNKQISQMTNSPPSHTHGTNKSDSPKKIIKKIPNNLKEFKPNYQIYSSQELHYKLENMSKDLASALHIDKSTASLLLRKYEWNKDRFMEAFVSDANDLFHKNKISLIKIEPYAPEKAEQEIECPICMNDILLSDTIGIVCN